MRLQESHRFQVNFTKPLWKRQGTNRAIGLVLKCHRGTATRTAPDKLETNSKPQPIRRKPMNSFAQNFYAATLSLVISTGLFAYAIIPASPAVFA